MPILDDRTLEFLSHSPEQTRRVGVRLGEMLNAGHLVCLEGDLGSGKTTLTQGIARGWPTDPGLRIMRGSSSSGCSQDTATKADWESPRGR